MWPINYDDPNKLHMSIGAGLLVAGFIFFLITMTYNWDNIERFEDKIEQESCLYNVYLESENKTYFSGRLEVLEKEINLRMIISYMMMGAGILLFLIGYIRYIKEWVKKK